MNKKSFTLIEVLVSISLLSIIVIFLYQALDVTQKSNLFFSKKLEKKEDELRIKKIFFKDIIYSISSTISDTNATQLTKNQQTIFQMTTTNSYHDNFYKNVTYLVSKENNLLRCESKDKFDKNKLTDKFFSEAYIDIIATGVQKFKVVEIDKNSGKYAIYLEFMKNDEKDNIMFVMKSKDK